jgi:hypothetical protein
VSLSSDIDDRTTAEQLRDLGVEVVRKSKKPTVANVSWAKCRRLTVPRRWKNVKPHISINKTYLYFNVAAIRILKPDGKKYQFGACDLNGKKAMILREQERGYRITIRRAGGSEFGQNGAPGLIRQLLKAGLDYGRYELVKAGGYDGVWMGVPM